MADARGSKFISIGEWLLAFALVLAASLLAKLFTRNALGIASIWLANGLVLGFLLTAPKQRWPGLLAVFALSQLAAAWLVGDTMRFALTTMLFHVTEIFVAARYLQGHISNVRELSRMRNFLRFLGTAAVVPLVSGLGVLIVLAITGVATVRLFDSWYFAHALGMAITTPVILALRSNELARIFRRENQREVVAVTALIVLITAGVFAQSTFPLQFLIFPPMLLAALRGGFAGTAFALILVTAIAAAATGMGRGPLMLMKHEGVDEFSIYLMLQVFVGVLMLTCFPVAVGMSAWRRKQHTERELRNQLRLLAEHSSDVVMLTDVHGKRVYVSPSVFDVLGWTPEQFQRETFRELVHATHYDDVQRQLEELRHSHRGKATITFPTRRADGSGLWLEARVRYFRDAGFLRRNAGSEEVSGDEGFVVTLRNVTRRKQAEQALENANRKLETLVMKDSLTGLGNRRHFDRLLAELWKQCGERRFTLAVVLLDIDHFKRYNDFYGHQQGDHCLRAVAQAIGSSVRERKDFACRYGGEEFAVLTANISLEEAVQVAERVRRDVEQLAMPHEQSPFGTVTVSVGMAMIVPHADLQSGSLVRFADKALYRSKAEGRNRVSAIEPGPGQMTEAADTPGSQSA